MSALSKMCPPDVLKRLQNCQAEMLKEFVKICGDNNISYFALAGTGIGALRHSGFIPWDDDVDIGLLYQDYQKLIEIYKKEYSDKYFIVNAQEHEKYPLMTTRICLKDTLFVTEAFKNVDCPWGIFLDLFPFFNVAKDTKEHKKQSRKAWFFGKLLILKHTPFPYLDFDGIKAKLVHCVTAICSVIVNILFSHKALYNKIMKECLKYQNTDTGKYEYFFETGVSQTIYTKEQIFPTKEVLFENIPLSFPNKLEDILTDMYGDYMQIPPPEKRKNPHICTLKFPGESEIHI